MDAITQFLQRRFDARNTYTADDNLHMTRDGFMIPPPPPAPESNPILGGNEIQGFPQPTADDAMQERAPSNEVGGRLSELAANALQVFGDDFGAAYQQYKLKEVSDRIEDGSLQPVDYQMAVIENPTVPLGDYYDAASGTFSGVPSDDYILHRGQLYPRVITDAQTGEEIDLSEDNLIVNFGRALMGGMMDPLEGATVTARAARQFLRGGAPDPTVMNMGMGGATVPVDRAADVSDIGFYSAVNRAVEALPMEKGSASQMRSMIAKAEGVKPEEMAWIGLDDFLKGKKSVTKAEVQEYVQANQVQIQEVVKGDLDTANIRVELIDGEHHLINDAGEIIDTYPGDAQGALDAVNAIPPNTNRPLSDTKFASYTLPGGENYREVLLTLPTKTGAATNAARYEELNNIAARRNLTDAESDEMVAIEQAEFSGESGRAGEDFVSGHFDEKNILAHMRLNDRTGPEGERILFIEEIQSDWHQKGRKAGYKTPEDTAAIAQINGRLVKLFDQEMEINGDLFDNYGLGGTALSDGKGVRFYSRDIIENNDYKNIGRVYANGSFYVDEAFGAANPAIADRIKELAEISAERAQLKQQRSEITGPSRELARVPDAPMKKTWHEMSFRRVARMAAEEGYDAIAWTPGKMQAERYDLSEQVDEIRYRQNEDGSFDIVPVRDGNTIQAQEFEGVTKDRLPDVVGKEMAEKMIKGEGESDPGANAQTLRGVDLEVGGAGMKGFYDKMLKNYAAKWGKKFGAKVGVTDIKSREYTQGEPVETGVPINQMNDQQLLGELGYSNIEDVETKVWTLPVTKKMRDSIMKKGVPLFTAGGAAAMSQVEREQNGN